MNRTPQSIAAYLDALKAALKGAPPGLIADALADAEEHLREAMSAHPGMSEAQAFAEMAGRYGTPQEVAAEYLAIETPPPGPFGAPVPASPIASSRAHRSYPGFFGVIKDPVTYGALLYMLLSLATGIFYFSWTVTGLSLSPFFLILIIGIPFFLLFIGSVRMFSYIEGRIVETLLGVRMPRRLSVPPAGRFWEKIKRTLKDVRTWSSLAYMLLMLPLGIVYFTAAVTGLALSGGLVFGGLWDLINFGHINVVTGVAHVGGLVINGHDFIGYNDAPHGSLMHAQGLVFYNPPDWMLPFVHTPLLGLFFIVVGILVFFLMLHIARAIGWLHGRLAEHLLVRL